MAQRLYLAYRRADAEWLASQVVPLNGDIVYSGLEPHLIFRSAHISAYNAVDFYRKLDFCAISDEAAQLHHRFLQVLREVGADYGIPFVYRDVDLLACVGHVLYYFFYEAVVSYHLAKAILNAYNPKEVWVNQLPLAPVTHWGVDPPRINYENQVWGCLKDASFVIKPLGSDRLDLSSDMMQRIIRRMQRWMWQSRRVAGAIKQKVLKRLATRFEAIQNTGTCSYGDSLRADILFALHHPYFTANYAPIGKALAGSFNLKTLDVVEQGPRLWFGWRDSLKNVPLPEPSMGRGELIAQVKRILNDSRFTLAFSDYPVDVWPLIKPRVDFLLRTDLPRAQAWVDRAYYIFATVHPKLLVQPEEISLPARTLAAVARLHGAKTLVIAHGSSISLDLREFGRQRTDLYHWYRIYGETTPDYLAVWGPYAKRTYVEGYGWPSDRIFITGWPWIEDAMRRVHSEETTTKQASHSHLRLLYLSGASLKFHYYLYEAIFRAAKHFEAKLVVRPHSSEELEGLKELACNLRTDIEIDRTTDLLKQIICSDIVLGGATSVLSYAIALEKPCIFVSLLELRDYLPYALEGAAIGVYEPEELIPAIESLLHNDLRNRMQEKQRRFTRDYLGPMDGKSVERIVNLVGELLQR